MFIKRIITGICFLIITSVSFSQTTDFYYKEKGRNQYSATIYFSSNNGAEDVSTDEFLNYQNVYFTIKPNAGSEKNCFKESELEDWFSKVGLYQNGVEIKKSATPKGFINADSKIDRVVLSFPKREVKLYKPFVFINLIDTTSALEIEDKYYNLYFKYLPIYEQGLELSDNMEYVKTFETVLKIIEDAEINAEIKYYGFYEHSSETLLQTAVRQYADSLSNMMDAANKEFLRKIDISSLNKIDSICSLMEDCKKIFMPFFQMDLPNSKIYYEEYLGMLEDANNARFDDYDLYKSKVLQFLEVEDYNLYKFNLFIDLLARMTTGLDTLKLLNGMDTLSVSAIDEMKKKKEELILIGWYQDFKTIVKMLNREILDSGEIFNDSIMANLQRLKVFEHQPYQQIFLAFNELANNEMLFVNYLRNALTYCTDEDLLLNMEMWILSYNLTYQNLSESTVHKINKGIRMVNQQSWDEAASTFSTITRQANTIAPPWYFLGKIQFTQDEVFSAEAKFNRALAIYPEYIAPRLYTFKLMYDQGEVEMLLPEIEEALLINDIWFFHFWRARALFALQKYKETVIELEQHCIRLNPYSIEEFFLLGDTYKAMKKYDLARKAYMKTNEIDMYKAEGLYDRKMQELKAESE